LNIDDAHVAHPITGAKQRNARVCPAVTTLENLKLTLEHYEHFAAIISFSKQRDAWINYPNQQ
jgi:hypothetical protein